MIVRSRRHAYTSVLSGLVALLVGCAALSASEARPRKGYGIGDGARGLVPGRDFVEAQVIVGLRESGSSGAVSDYTPPAGGRIAAVMQGPTVVIQFSTEEVAQRAIPLLLTDSRLTFVERNGIMRIPPMPPPPKKDPRQQ
jgi:hypothetical protein